MSCPAGATDTDADGSATGDGSAADAASPNDHDPNTTANDNPPTNSRLRMATPKFTNGHNHRHVAPGKGRRLRRWPAELCAVSCWRANFLRDLPGDAIRGLGEQAVGWGAERQVGLCLVLGV